MSFDASILADHVLNRSSHAGFCMRCLFGLPGSMAEADSSRVAVGFYCLGGLEISGLLDAKLKQKDREGLKEWIWTQQVKWPLGDISNKGSSLNGTNGYHIGGFRPSPFMHIESQEGSPIDLSYDPPHLIMTYTSLLSLSILRDDFTQLDRKGLVNLLRATQKEDGSFTAIPNRGEADIRMVYAAFVISTMLDDWSGVNVESAIAFVKKCLTYEGGFGQTPGNEAQGGPTYCALAALALAPAQYTSLVQLQPDEHKRVLRWLIHKQDENGGFRGRTQKDADVCYSFWCGAALNIIGAGQLVHRPSNASFLARSQFRIGGLGKAPDVRADPYHTYLGLAALAIYPPFEDEELSKQLVDESQNSGRVPILESWTLPRFEPLLNATEETALWAKVRISGKNPA